jgi:hypothetical protein
MYCPACGALNEDNAAFCGSCGTNLSGEAQLPPSGVEASQDTLAEVTAGVEEGQQSISDTVAGVDAAQEGLHQPFPEESGAVVPPAEEVPAVPTPAVAPLPRVTASLAPGRTSSYAAPSGSPPTSGLAIASLILGIGGFTFLPLLGSIVGVILGYMARDEIRRRPGHVAGDGVATIGLVLGWIGIGLTVLAFILFGSIAVCALCGAFGSSWSAN